MNKVYITDLDHTFLRSDLSISGFTKQTWNDKSEHAYLSIATARSFYSASSLLEGFNINAPLILLDGSLIVSADKKIIDTKFLDQEAANRLIDEAIRLFDLHPFVIGLNGSDLDESFDFPQKLTQVQKQLLINYKDDARLIQRKKINATDQTFKVVYMGSQEEMFPLTDYLREHFGNTFEFKLSPENYTKGYFLTILHPYGDKAHGLQRLSEHVQRPLKDITVFGDSINDIGMFRLAGTSVAVSNALEQTKAVADIILEHSNDDDGVAHYLNNTIRS
jgi:Cof subfamily protein (haloacid dehalogenase superfamily)